ncbi:MAG: TIGR03088 family PEP-CTERM/XrtA system glycosyltransferase [Proteobacteria bacterium]|nr:TIGR03088 family PEP-CTERM/XrtA system glycosyltransferase [Pseudomonadota bacterium]
MKKPPLVVHIIHRLAVGGLENGLVNLINIIPPDRYRHIIICLKDATNFRERISDKNVQIYCLNKNDGNDFNMFYRLYRLLCDIRPDIVHTRNISTLECQLPALLSGVRRRVHGEHGWDIYDPFGNNLKYLLLRRFYRPIIDFYIPLSLQLKQYLTKKIGIPESKIRHIKNGVDTDTFKPIKLNIPLFRDRHFSGVNNLFIIGTVGRMHGVKDQTTLVNAFLKLLEMKPEAKSFVRLVMIGDGPLRQQSISTLSASGVADLAWLPGERNDIADILNAFDIFVLPSTAEGISNVILEAMATGLPVVATSVGGNPELIADYESGRLVEHGNPLKLAEILAYYIDKPDILKAHGAMGLLKARSEYSIDVMANGYLAVYDELMQTKH